MKKIFILSCVILVFGCLQLRAQDTKKSGDIDPLDISKQLEQIEKYGVPTIATVDEMKSKADALFESQLWKEAALAYEVYAKNVNWLANLLSQCVEPYYSASYDDRESVSYTIIEPFIPFEIKANECIEQRNIAYVKIGLCYKNKGDIKNAIAYLHKGLDLLSLDELSYWTIAKDAIAEILQFDVEETITIDYPLSEDIQPTVPIDISTEDEKDKQVIIQAPVQSTGIGIEEDADVIFQVVESMPSFPGGDAALFKYLNENINYPVVAKDNGIQGRVICQFVVNRDGTLVDIEVVRSVDKSLDAEAIRVIDVMPRWTPGMQRGKTVRVKYTLPINFRLN